MAKKGGAENQSFRSRIFIEVHPRPFRLGWVLILALAWTPFGWARQNFLKMERLTIEDGLSQNGGNAIFQDRQGFMWIGTQDGLNRYDGVGFVVYSADSSDPGALSGSNVVALAEDTAQRLWVGTLGGGVSVFTAKRDRFLRFRADPENPHSLSDNLVRAIFCDRFGQIWIGTDRAVNRYEPEQKGFRHFLSGQEVLPDGGALHVSQILQHPDGFLWVATRGAGLLRLDPDTGSWIPVAVHDREGRVELSRDPIEDMAYDRRGHLWCVTPRGAWAIDAGGRLIHHVTADRGGRTGLLSDAARRILVDDEGRVWIGTDAGLSRYRPGADRWDHFVHDPADPSSLCLNLITALFQDRSGLIWVGTEGGGLNKMNPKAEAFRLYRAQPQVPQSLPATPVISFHEDRQGTVWVGTEGSGLCRFDPEDDTFQVYRHDPQDPETLSNDYVRSIDEDREGFFWIPTRNGLNRFDPKTGKARRYMPDPEAPIAFDSLVDRLDRLWVASFGGGLFLMDSTRESFVRYTHDPGEPNSLVHNMTLSLGEDSLGHIWVGTYGGGTSRLDPDTGRFTSYRHDPENPRTLGDNSVVDFFEDSRRRFWLGTVQGGLQLFQRESNSFRGFDTGDGLPNNTVYAIEEDGQGYLWLSTNIGLSRFDPELQAFDNFDARYNLQSNEFNQAASLRAANGDLYFGGIYGFNVFRPERVRRNPVAPPVVLTAFKKFHEPQPLAAALDEDGALALSFRDSLISFEFAALDYTAPHRNHYAYMLEGFHENWIELGHKNDVTFTNLDPGNYRLRVKAANNDGVWSEGDTGLAIHVIPPPWKSRWAYACYSLSAMLLVGGIWRYQKYRFDKARSINQRLMRVDRLKDEFLANTSHELRTPLNGIIGIAESVLEGAAGTINGRVRENLKLMVSSGRRLDSLINDILDFSKMRHHSLELRRKGVDIFAVTEVVLTVCRGMASHGELTLENRIPRDFPKIWADENRLHQILYNLVGNAVKFTRSGGVSVQARVRQEMAEIRVVDTGIGIPYDKIHSIFDSFEQVEGSDSREFGGTGLGLAITKKLVHLHGGKVHVSSKVGHGSTFAFTMPLAADRQPEAIPLTLEDPGEWRQPEPEPHAQELGDITLAAASREGQRFHVMVVDDEPVNRRVLVNLLSMRGYRVTALPGGEEALAYLEEGEEMDLVLLDIMMPRVTGFEVLKQIRLRHPIHELPVIFLTAKNQESDYAHGFETGCNDYIAKPFAKDELLARVQTHLHLRHMTLNLEAAVAERTNAIYAYVRELETLDDITKTINREMEFQKVLPLVLEQGMTLFPQAEIGTFMFLGDDRKFFRIQASAGYRFEDLGTDPGFFYDQAIARYTRGTEQLAPGIYIVRNPEESTRPTAFRHQPLPKSLLAMEVTLHGRLEGFLVLDHSSSPEGFREEDVERLVRFREHAVSALSRAKVLKNLADTQRELIEAAHMFGMAENATLVMHNMGNNLNSVNTSLQVLLERLGKNRWLRLLERLDRLLRRQTDLVHFFSHDDRANQVPRVVSELAAKLREWCQSLLFESERLEEHVQEVLKALREQRDYAIIKSKPELADLNGLVDAVLGMDGVLAASTPIRVQRDFVPLPPIRVQKIQLMRILYCVLRNAVDAIVEGGTPDGCIAIHSQVVKEEDNRLISLVIEDNGVGVDRKNLGMVFTQGYSTKVIRKGYGLHNCANAIHEMGGSIEIESDGLGKGARVVLRFEG
ncbi:Response regulator [Sulfidibacter corallicola]|uniref:histidine kinase n=1 Tax=Sulfidibacter corallicola TaxID=2818388 RepID=A0A8A4TPU8_SULCO|nr:two-component regulator propeller domain-containing protein [Sulfidibacter corallicola]QTD51214.1 response regulator [Sulfidibacter corallicola]